MEDCVEEVAKLVREEEDILRDLRCRKADADGAVASSHSTATVLRQQLEEASRAVTSGQASAAASSPVATASSSRYSLAAMGTTTDAGGRAAAAASVVTPGGGAGPGAGVAAGLPTVKGSHATPRTLGTEGMRSAPQTSHRNEAHGIGLGPSNAVATTATAATAEAGASTCTSSMPSSSTTPAANPSGSVSPGTRCDFCGRLGHRVGAGLLGRGRVRPLFTCPLLVEQTWSAADVRGVLNEDSKLPSEWARCAARPPPPPTTCPCSLTPHPPPHPQVDRSQLNPQLRPPPDARCPRGAGVPPAEPEGAPSSGGLCAGFRDTERLPGGGQWACGRSVRAHHPDRDQRPVHQRRSAQQCWRPAQHQRKPLGARDLALRRPPRQRADQHPRT